MIEAGEMSDEGGTGIIGNPAVDSATGAEAAFAAELGGAMHSVARGWHERLKDEAERYRSSHRAQIDERSEAEAAELRADVDGDLGRIDGWTGDAKRQVENARARQVDALHKVLDERLELHRSVVAAEIEAVDAAVAGYVTDLDGFFARLAAESDPEVIASLTGSIPHPPDVDRAAEAARARAEAEIARQATQSAGGSTPTVAPEDAVPVMDPAAISRSTLLDSPWVVATSDAGDPDADPPAAIEPGNGGLEDVVATAAPASEAPRSAGSLQRLAGIFGRGGATPSDPPD
jgi:hypothetical protein